MIIDSTGNGGGKLVHTHTHTHLTPSVTHYSDLCFAALLTHTFRQLGFHVFPYTQTEVCEVCEVNLIMKTINQNSILQRAAVFTCFMLNTHTHASHTPPLNTHIKLMEACVECEMLKKKPKLFFNHTIRSDQNLQTDALPCTTHTPHTHPLHNAEDVLWSVCETGVEVLDGNEHNSVYLQSISSALLQGHTRYEHVTNETRIT